MTPHSELFRMFRQMTGKTIYTPHDQPDPQKLVGYQVSRTTQFAYQEE